MTLEEQLFRRSSTTYYFSSKFFPRGKRQDIFDLYSFVRVADDYVDATPPDKESFYQLRRLWLEAGKSLTYSFYKKDDDSLNQRAVKNIVRLAEQYDFDQAWIQDFLDTMQADLVVQNYETLEESLKYVYGSAEVVGLMLAKILELPPVAADAARTQGRAMQWINFIRDIAEDNDLGRRYFPSRDLEMFGLKDLSEETALSNPAAFKEFMHFQIERCKTWQLEANDGYKHIPKRQRIAIQTARDMYNWTANVIAKDPLVVYSRKVKPSKDRILRSALTNSL